MERSHTRRGNAAITALSLSALLGFAALAIDLGYVRVVDIQLHAALEAGVLGGVSYLDGTAAGAQAALQQAATIAQMNPILGGQALDTNAFQLGIWDGDEFQAVGLPNNDAQAQGINALRVQIDYTGIPAILAGAAFKKDTLSTSAAAMAVRSVGGPAGSVDCFLPIALPACAFDPDAETNPDPILVGPGNQDTMGWAHPGNNVNQNVVKGYFTGTTGCGSTMTVGDQLPVMNGVGSANTSIIAALNGQLPNGIQPGTWPYDTFPSGPPLRGGNHAFAPPGGGGGGGNGNGNGTGNGNGNGGGGGSGTSGVTAPNWGNVIAGPIAIVEMGSCDENGTPSMQWNQKRTIKGFTWGFIYDQNTANGNSAGTYIQLDFVNEYDFGTGSDPDAMGNIIVKDEPPKLVSPF